MPCVICWSLAQELQDHPRAAISQYVAITYDDIRMTDPQRAGCGVEAVSDGTLS
jgi:hypothetical protein